MQNPREIEYSYFGCIFDDPPRRIVEALDVGTKIFWFSDIVCALLWTAIENLMKRMPVDEVKALLIIQEANRITLNKKSRFYGINITPEVIDEAKRFRASSANGDDNSIIAYAKFLRQQSIERRLRDAMATTSDRITLAADKAEMAEDLITSTTSILADELVSKEVPIGELLDRARANRDKAYEEFTIKHNFSYIDGIPFPWFPLSKKLNGLKAGLHIVGARPSVGKTSFVLQCMEYWCQLGYRVVFNCLDMDVTEAILRPIATKSIVSLDAASSGHVSPMEQKRMNDADADLRERGNLGIITFLNERDIDRFVTWCSIRILSEKLDIIIVDFLQVMTARGKQTEYEMLKYATATFKALANRYHIPVILLSQCNRANVTDKNGEREPEISDLRGSGTIEQDATTVTLLHVDSGVLTAWNNENEPPVGLIPMSWSEETQLETKEALTPIWVIIKKNQNGKPGRFPFVLYNNFFRWYMGDHLADRLASGVDKNRPKFEKIRMDWRCGDDIFLNADKCRATVRSEHWVSDMAREFGSLGMPVPPDIEAQFKDYDRANYQQLFEEREQRLLKAREAAERDNYAMTKELNRKMAEKSTDTQGGGQGGEPPTPEEQAFRKELEEMGKEDTSAPPSEEPDFDDEPF